MGVTCLRWTFPWMLYSYFLKFHHKMFFKFQSLDTNLLDFMGWLNTRLHIDFKSVGQLNSAFRRVPSPLYQSKLFLCENTFNCSHDQFTTGNCFKRVYKKTCCCLNPILSIDYWILHLQYRQHPVTPSGVKFPVKQSIFNFRVDTITTLLPSSLVLLTLISPSGSSVEDPCKRGKFK